MAGTARRPASGSRTAEHHRPPGPGSSFSAPGEEAEAHGWGTARLLSVAVHEAALGIFSASLGFLCTLTPARDGGGSTPAQRGPGAKLRRVSG